MSFAVTPQQINAADPGPINVKWFGAVGDGSADDTAALQSVFNAMPEYRGSIYFPPGVYVTDPLIVNNKYNFNISGDGRETSVLWLKSSGNLLTISNGNFSTIENLGFSISGTPQGISNTSGLVINGTSGNMQVSECDFIGFADDGLFINGTVEAPLSGNKVLDCIFLGNGRYQLRKEYSNDFHINKCQYGMLSAIPHAQVGCYLVNSGAGTYTENYHWNNVRGMQADSCNQNTYSLNRFEESDNEGVYITGGAASIFTSNKLHTNSQSGDGQYDNMYVSGTTTFIFANNNIFSWNAKYSRWGVNFDNTNMGLTINKNRVRGYDTVNFGPIRISGDTALAGISADAVFRYNSRNGIPQNTISYLGINGEYPTQWSTYWMAESQYCILLYRTGSTAAPGSGESYTGVLNIDNINTIMSVTTTGDDSFGNTVATTAPQVTIANGSSLVANIAISTGAIESFHRGFVVLAEY